MKRDGYKLFSKGEIADLPAKNRLIRAATYEGGMTEDGKTTPPILDLYKNLADGGVGAIITGHMTVALEGKVAERQTCIYDDSFISEIKKNSEVVHGMRNDCKIFAQLNYAGRQVFHDNKVANCVGPSEVPSPILKNKAKALSVKEIKKMLSFGLSQIPEKLVISISQT